MTEMHRVLLPFSSRRAAAYLARGRTLVHSLGESGRGIGAALPPFLQVPAAAGSERIGAALHLALRVAEGASDPRFGTRTIASSRRKRPWPTWARKLVHNSVCCIAVRADMGIAIVPTRRWPNQAEPRDFLDLEGKLTWLPPSVSDTELGTALMDSFARCE